MATGNNQDGEQTTFTITKLTPGHMTHVRMMIQELAVFEKMPDAPQLSPEALGKDLEKNAFFGWIAFAANDEPAGMTICYCPYSTWEGVFLHMEDLYVRQQFRKSGLGRKLVAVVCKEALEKGYKRVQWNVLDWNPARAFYEKLSAENLSEKEGWLTYRMGPQQIASVAAEAEDH